MPFFEQPQLESLLGDDFLQLQGLALEVFDFAGGCGSGRVAGETAFAGFEEFLRPAEVKALGDAFTLAEFHNRNFAAQAVRILSSAE